MAERKCCDCGEEIVNCQGFVLAGDFVLAIIDKLDWGKVRERCAECVEKAGGAQETKI